VTEKPVTELQPGDKVLMEDGVSHRTVKLVSPGFVTFKAAEGRTGRSLLIDFKDGDFTHVRRDMIVTLA
jgi:hypothetical protein